jgi:hypothetical protein
VTAVDELVLLAQAGGRREWLPPVPATTPSSRFDYLSYEAYLFDRFKKKGWRQPTKMICKISLNLTHGRFFNNMKVQKN